MVLSRSSSSFERYHLAVLVLAEHGEEVQQREDALLARVHVAAPGARVGVQVVGELFEYCERARRVEVEHVGVLLAEELAVLLEQAGVLSAEGGLHVQ